MVKFVKDNNDTILAIIIPAEYSGSGIEFFTPEDYSQQMAYMNHKVGHVISPHVHNHIERHVLNTQEVLIVKRGVLRVDFYLDDLNYYESRIVKNGDIIMLVSGGHGFEVLEDVEMIEIKQGPYLGDNDKVRFENNEIRKIVE